jgi:hypothetical protein
MDSIKEDIHSELRRLRLDKTHLYTTLLKIIDAIPQAEAPVVQAEPVAEVPVVEKVPVVEETPPPTPVKKTGGRKKKITVEA